MAGKLDESGHQRRENPCRRLRSQARPITLLTRPVTDPVDPDLKGGRAALTNFKMIIEGALIQEQGVRFAVVVVKRHIIQDQHLANRAIAEYRPVFGGIPVVLMAQDHRGLPTYFGRNDIVRFLANTPLEAIPWRQFTLN